MMLYPDDPFLPESEAQEILSLHHTQLAQCVIDAAATLNAIKASNVLVARALSATTGAPHASLMNAMVVELIRDRFDPDAEAVELREENGFFELRVDAAIDLRFKQVDGNGESRNLPTVNVWLYRNQLPLHSSDGTDEVQTARVTIGWRWDAAVAEIADIKVVYAKGKDIVWHYSIIDDADDGVVVGGPTSLPGNNTGSTYFVEDQGESQTGVGA